MICESPAEMIASVESDDEFQQKGKVIEELNEEEQEDKNEIKDNEQEKIESQKEEEQDQENSQKEIEQNEDKKEIEQQLEQQVVEIEKEDQIIEEGEIINNTDQNNEEKIEDQIESIINDDINQTKDEQEKGEITEQNVEEQIVAEESQTDQIESQEKVNDQNNNEKEQVTQEKVEEEKVLEEENQQNNKQENKEKNEQKNEEEKEQENTSYQEDNSPGYQKLENNMGASQELNLKGAIKQVGLQSQNGINDILGDTLFIKKNYKFDNSKLETFEIKKLLGRGAFGKVMLVQHRITKKLYAMKSIRKDIVIAQEQLENVKQERAILEKIDHPFLVGMEYAFQTSEKLYFILPYKPGGELFFHLKNVRRFPESRAKFYAAELIIALEYLHAKNIAFRDIKPENILLDQEGHLALIDFGIAKELPKDNYNVYDIVGTPEYVAPEVLAEDSETKGFNAFLLDWWSLGCLTFEMLVGLPPFLHKHQEKLFKMILTQQHKYPELVSISPRAKEFIDSLLEKDPTKRLGANGAEEVKAHKWFLTINWTSLNEKKVKPPFIPQLSKDAADLKYVDEEFKNQEIVNSVMPEEMHEIVANNQNQFEDFEYEQKEQKVEKEEEKENVEEEKQK